MKMYEITFKEVLSKTVIVAAESKQDAEDIAEDMYANEQVVLGGDDMDGCVDIKVKRCKDEADI